MSTHIKKVIGLVIILSCLLGGVGYAQGELTLEGLAERLGLVETRTDELAGRVATLESHLLSTTVEDTPTPVPTEKTGGRTTVTAIPLETRVATLESSQLSATVEDTLTPVATKKAGTTATATAEGAPIATQAVTAIPDVCSNSSALPDPEPASLVADCNILLAAKNTLDPSGVLNWHQDKLIFQWNGVEVGEQGVTRYVGTRKTLMFQWDGVEVGEGASLWKLDLDDRGLTGRIPAVLGNLSKLEVLSLSLNDLTGEIPAALGNLSKLEALFLSDNDLTGEIPAALGNLSNLRWLFLYDNDLTGEIPAALGNLSNLERLSLSDNDLTGEIPAALGNLSNLQSLWLRDNNLTGPIPPKLGNIDALYLYGNESLGCLPNTFPGYRNDMISNQKEGMSFCDAETPTANPTGDAKSTPTPMATSLSEGADQIDWETLFRYNEEHVGKSVAFKGNVLQVVQVEESCFLGVCSTNFSAIDDATEGDVALRVAVTRSSYGSWDDAVMLLYRSPPTRILEDDLIEFVAEVKGLYSYNAIMGNEVTIPLLEVTQLRLIEEN